MERIIDAALRVCDCISKDEGLSMSEIVICGRRHADCFEQLYKHWKYDRNKVKQGFYTDKGNFLDRYEAMELALKNGQLAQPTEFKELWSEDLW